MAIDILKAFRETPPALDFIWPGFLAGTVGALIAPGATGKSFWALQAAMAVACGVSGGDLIELQPKQTGLVTYLAGEDPAVALINRIHSIGEHIGPDAQAAIAENMRLEVVSGAEIDVMSTEGLSRILTSATDARLIVLDTLSRIHCLDENSNSDMARLVGRLERIAAESGASVLYLHHVNKGSVRDGQSDQQQAARGASALIDNARWCGYVASMTEEEARHLRVAHGFDPVGAGRRAEFVRFGGSKENYTAEKPEQWYRRARGGVLLPVELNPIKKQARTQGTKVNQDDVW